MLAVANNKKKSVKKLLESRANPNEKDNYNNSTSIVFAGEYHSDDCNTLMLKILIEHDCYPKQLFKYNQDVGEGWYGS